MPEPRSFAYADRPAGTLELDLHHPGGGVRPLVLFAYGGGFVKGSRIASRNSALVAHLCGAGFAVAAPDYRLNTGPEDVSPETLAGVRRIANRAVRHGIAMRRRLFGVRLFTACEDLSDALTFCRARADEMEVDARHIGMFGISAGGLAGNTLCYPPGPWTHLSAPDAMVALAAPVVHPWRLRRDGPPVWIVHGQRDRIVPCADSLLTAREAQAAGAPVRVTAPPDAPHVGIDRYVLNRTTDQGQTYMDAFAAFLRSGELP